MAGENKPGRADQAQPGNGGMAASGQSNHTQPSTSTDLRQSPENTKIGGSFWWRVGEHAEARGMAMLKNIPAELRERRQFVGYRLIPSKTRPGKTEKIPIDPHSGRNASTTNPATWGTFAEACQATSRYGLAGVGFVFTAEDPYCGIDLDGAVVDGKLAPWARAIIERLDSYIEFSVSGTGVHIICRAKLPAGSRRRGAIEMYDTARFFAMTGNILRC